MLSGKRFDGPVANYTNIDTSATSVMVTNHYVNKSSFTVRTGGRSTDVSGASDRMYSFYFQNFAYGTPVNSILDVKNERVRPEKRNAPQVKLNMYPNPVAGKLNIEYPDTFKSDKRSIRLYDLAGNLIHGSVNKNASTDQVDMSTLKPGVYMIQVIAGEQKSVHRIVKI